MRIGFGYDIHALVNNRKLILGGVEIPFEKGLQGHSDADVLSHAVTDALLGAAAMGDIGQHFPDTDDSYKDADSLVLLGRAGMLLSDQKYTILNIDATIIAEAPKLMPFRHQMQMNIEQALQLKPGTVSVKAATNEGFGETGEKRAVKAFAVALIQSMI